MNALDKAFIRAFAKDHPAAADSTESEGSSVQGAVSAPAENIEAVSLVLHELYEQGKRLRIDHPQAELSELAAHMTIAPLVQQVQSYELDQVQQTGPAQVMFEDKLAPLEEPVDTTARGETAEATPDSAQRAKREGHQTEEPPADDGPDAWMRYCAPQTELAAPQLCYPELMTQWIGQPDLNIDLPLATVSGTEQIMHSGLDWQVLADYAEQEPLAEQLPVACDPPQLAVVPESAAEAAALPAEEPRPSVMLDDGASSHRDRVEPVARLFTPAWEVDAFRWPPLCDQLDEQTQGRLTQAGDELFIANQDGLKVLAVTSCARQEGRSTLALALARAAARAGSRIALLDADVANPELARRLGMEAPCDWRDVVQRGEPLSEAAVTSLDDGVTLFPRTSSIHMETVEFETLLFGTLERLREAFDLVVIDLPPVDRRDPARHAPGQKCPIDMAVVVRNMLVTGEEQCMSTVAELRKLGVQAVGVIENFVPAGESV